MSATPTGEVTVNKDSCPHGRLKILLDSVKEGLSEDRSSDAVNSETLKYKRPIYGKHSKSES